MKTILEQLHEKHDTNYLAIIDDIDTEIYRLNAMAFSRNTFSEFLNMYEAPLNKLKTLRTVIKTTEKYHNGEYLPIVQRKIAELMDAGCIVRSVERESDGWCVKYFHQGIFDLWDEYHIYWVH